VPSENGPYSLTPLLNLDHNDYTSPSVKSIRKIGKMPFKVLDAPSLQDDFYLNLVDWSASNILAVGLGRAVYIWSACTSRVTKLCEVPSDDSITSVGWSVRGSHLAVGTNSGDTQIWDTNHCKMVRTLTGHLSRVGAVAWNGSIVSTGSRDRNILQRDLRA
jgi:cell division cycle 20-like protein 1, cofactor of APC complex